MTLLGAAARQRGSRLGFTFPASPRPLCSECNRAAKGAGRVGVHGYAGTPHLNSRKIKEKNYKFYKKNIFLKNTC